MCKYCIVNKYSIMHYVIILYIIHPVNKMVYRGPRQICGFVGVVYFRTTENLRFILRISRVSFPNAAVRIMCMPTR